MSFFTFLSELLSGLLSGHPESAAHDAARCPRVGAIYRRNGGPQAAAPVEYAEVTGLRSDECGIRHIRFQLILGYREKVVTAGERTLSAECFVRRFHEKYGTRPDLEVTMDSGIPARIGEDARLQQSRNA